MRFIVLVTLSGFYAYHLVRIEPELAGQPVLVERDKLVLDADPIARQRGVWVGMAIKSAKAMVEGVQVRRFEPDHYRDARREWLEHCVPFSSIIQPLDPHEALLDLSDHPDPADIHRRLVAHLSTRVTLPVRSGAGANPWLARLAMQTDDAGLAWQNPAEFLGPLPIGKLLPVAPEHRRQLSFLGYDTIGAIQSLPLKLLKDQFGADAVRIQQAASGGLNQPVEAIFPEQSLGVAKSFQPPIENRLELDAILLQLAQRLSRALANKDLVARNLVVYIHHESEAITRLDRVFRKDIRTPRELFSALQRLVGESPNEPIQGVRVHLPDLIQSTMHQIAFGGPADPCAFNSALNQIQGLYGDNSIQLGSEIRLPRRVQVLRAWREATGWQ